MIAEIEYANIDVAKVSMIISSVFILLKFIEVFIYLSKSDDILSEVKKLNVHIKAVKKGGIDADELIEMHPLKRLLAFNTREELIDHRITMFIFMLLINFIVDIFYFINESAHEILLFVFSCVSIVIILDTLLLSFVDACYRVIFWKYTEFLLIMVMLALLFVAYKYSKINFNVILLCFAFCLSLLLIASVIRVYYSRKTWHIINGVLSFVSLLVCFGLYKCNYSFNKVEL